MVGFVLFDPQDPMSKIVQKVMIGERPSLLQGRVGKPSTGNHRRHIIAYDVLAKALRKILKGHSLGVIATWLDIDGVWLDVANVQADRKPVDGTGKVVRTVFGVQAATAGWMKNATNHAANLFIGPKTFNLQLSGAYTTGRDTVKAVWEGETVALADYYKIFCCEISSGRLVRFESMGRFYSPTSEVIQAVMSNKFNDQFFFRAEPGVRFVGIPIADKANFDGYVENRMQEAALAEAKAKGDLGLVGSIRANQNFIAEMLSRSIAALYKQHLRTLGGGLLIRRDKSSKYWITKVARDYKFLSLVDFDVHTNPRAKALEKAQAQYLTGSVDVNADQANVNMATYLKALQTLKITGPDGKTVLLYDVAVGGLDRGKYVTFPSNVPQL